MSVFDSAKSNFSASEMSLVSSSNMYSDGDYETSSEISSPRLFKNNDLQISRCSSSIDCATNYADAMDSNISLVDDLSLDTNRYSITTKSDTCLPQNNTRIVSECMDDAIRAREHELESKKSMISTEMEFFLAQNILDSLPIDKESLDPIKISNTNGINNDQEYKSMCSSFSEAKSKILENLAQVNCSNLFSKLSSELPNDSAVVKVTPENKTHNRSRLKVIGGSVQKSRFSRRLYRSCGVESLLRIDNELQPLNLKLSKLLAEFRAMNLRECLNDYLSNPSVSSLRSVDESMEKFVVSEVESFTHDRCLKTANDYNSANEKEIISINLETDEDSDTISQSSVSRLQDLELVEKSLEECNSRLIYMYSEDNMNC